MRSLWRPNSRIQRAVRRLTTVIYGLVALSLLAGMTYAVTSTPSRPVELRHQTLADFSYGSPYAVGETYGGTNPVETCAGCDFWGHPEVGTSSPPSTDPADMVNPATGDLAENYTLFSAPDPGLNFEFNLSYDSLEAQLATYFQILQIQGGQTPPPSPFGTGWRAPTDTSVKYMAPSGGTPAVYDVILPTGAIEQYWPTSCPIGTESKTIYSSEIGVCAADRVNARFGAFNMLRKLRTVGTRWTAGVYLRLLRTTLLRRYAQAARRHHVPLRPVAPSRVIVPQV